MLPSNVLAAVNAAILSDPDEVNDIFDLIAEAGASEIAADKAAKLARREWSELKTTHPVACTCLDCYNEVFRSGGMMGGGI